MTDDGMAWRFIILAVAAVADGWRPIEISR